MELVTPFDLTLTQTFIPSTTPKTTDTTSLGLVILTRCLLNYLRGARLNLHAHEHVRGVGGERRFGNHRTADVHERVEEVAEGGQGTLESNDERIALELLICQVQQGDDTSSKQMSTSSIRFPSGRARTSRED